MKRTRVKICGLTRLQDVSASVEAGADALGFVFAPLSSRVLDSSTASALVSGTPAFIDRVGLFQDQSDEEVGRILDEVPLSLLQFHGSEPASFCRKFGLPYIKAVSMGLEGALRHAEAEFADAAGLVLDSHEPGKPGGTGLAFDWSLVQACSLPVIIAGGLTVTNVFEAIRKMRPWAVDVSSGVEAAPGVKDSELIKEFIGEVERGYRTGR